MTHTQAGVTPEVWPREHGGPWFSHYPRSGVRGTGGRFPLRAPGEKEASGPLALPDQVCVLFQTGEEDYTYSFIRHNFYVLSPLSVSDPG